MGLEQDFKVIRNVSAGLDKFFETVDMSGCPAISSLFRSIQLHFAAILSNHSPEEFEREIAKKGIDGSPKMDVGVLISAISDWILGSKHAHPRIPATILGILLYRAKAMEEVSFEEVRNIIAELEVNSEADENCSTIGLMKMGKSPEDMPKMSVLSKIDNKRVSSDMRDIFKAKLKGELLDDAFDSILDILEKEEEPEEEE